MDNWIFSRLISIACLLSNAVKRFDWNYWFRIHLLEHVNKPKQLALSSYLNSEQQLLNKWNNWMLRLALNAKIDRNRTCDQLTYSNGSWPFNHKIAMWRKNHRMKKWQFTDAICLQFHGWFSFYLRFVRDLWDPSFIATCIKMRTNHQDMSCNFNWISKHLFICSIFFARHNRFKCHCDCAMFAVFSTILCAN